MEVSPCDRLFLNIASALREYEAVQPDHEVTIDLSIALPAIGNIQENMVMKFLSASFAQKAVDSLNRDGKKIPEPNDELESVLIAISNSGYKDIALTLAREIVKTYPRNPNAHKWLAEAYWRAKMIREMRDSFQEAVHLAESEEWLQHHDISTLLKIRHTSEQLLNL
jgi:hypothetical protein